MYILSEKDMEDVLTLHPELIEEGLTLIVRQQQLEDRRTDLIFRDRNGKVLLVELKKGTLINENVTQIADYIQRYKRNNPSVNLRAMLIGQYAPESIRILCNSMGIEYKEIANQQIYYYLQNSNAAHFESLFFEGKLHEEAKKVKQMGFSDYLKATSPFGVPYTSYQHHLARDASKELSENTELNQKVADEFIRRIIEVPFDRNIFQGKMRLYRTTNIKPVHVTYNVAWQGINIAFTLEDVLNGTVLPCEVYLGTIGYRGNRPTFADEKSRFIVVRIGKSKNTGSTQYGFHKYLRTEKRCLYPYYELVFPNQVLPKVKRPLIYDALLRNGYILQDTDSKTEKKYIFFGNVSLDASHSENQIQNLIEVLFAVAITKEHFKEKHSFNI